MKKPSLNSRWAMVFFLAALTIRMSGLALSAVCAFGVLAATVAIAADMVETTPATGGMPKTFVYQNPIKIGRASCRERV